MSAQPSQPYETKPTFTARSGRPVSAVAPEPTDPSGAPDGKDPGRVRRAPSPAAAPAPTVPVPAQAAPALPDKEAKRALPAPAPASAGAPAEEPLLADAAALRERWQRVQASFVDAPQDAVGDAADLVEQTAQALVGALRQQQRQLRVMWEHGPGAGSDGGKPAQAADTEHLRVMMQRYRALFNQLCRP